MKKTYQSPITKYVLQPTLRLMSDSTPLQEGKKRLTINTSTKLYGALD